MFRRHKSADRKRRRASNGRSVRSLLTSEQFILAIQRESARVDRAMSGDLTMVLFRVTPSRRWRLSVVRLVRTILSRIRVTDDIGWFDRDHIGMLLPETSSAGAWKLSQSICGALSKYGATPLCTLYNYPAPPKAKADIPKGMVA
jgi:hypothetical protein